MTGIFRKWWLWGLAVVLIAAAGTAYWLWPRKYKLTVSAETTVLLGPLNPDGTVNYVAALNQMYGEGVTPDSNAAVLLIQAAGPELLPELIRARVLKHLGMGPLSESGSYFVGLHDFVSGLHTAESITSDEMEELQDRLRKELEDVISSPWSAGDYPLIARWLKASETPLGLVISASRRQKCFIPQVSPCDPPTLCHVILPDLGLYRSMGRALAARAMLKADEGQTDGAISDLLAAHRLARLVGRGPTLSDKLTGLAVERHALRGSRGLATKGKLTAAQARHFLAALEALPPLPDAAGMIDQNERFSALDSVAVLARESWRRGSGGAPGEGLRRALERKRVNADWDEVLRKLNQWFDKMVAGMRQQTFSQRCAAGESVQEAFLEYYGAVMDRERWPFSRAKAGNVVVCTLVSSCNSVRISEDRAMMRLGVAKVAVALAAWKAEKGAYPEKLSELEPEYLRKLPQDICAEGPLTYRRVGKGYLLYSVGENMKDDGGRNNEDEEGRKEEFDDIAVRAE